MKREKSIVKIKVANEISDANEIRTRERGERGKEYLEDFSVVKCFQVFTSTMSSSSSSTSSPPARVVLEVHHLERDVLYHVRELGATSLFQQSIALYVGALIFAALLGLFVYFCIWASKCFATPHHHHHHRAHTSNLPWASIVCSYLCLSSGVTKMVKHTRVCTHITPFDAFDDIH